MLECFDLDAACTEAQLWAKYEDYYKQIDGLRIAQTLKEALLLALNDAYDSAREHTSESAEAAASPRLGGHGIGGK
jgi:hypothetical protein